MGVGVSATLVAVDPVRRQQEIFLLTCTPSVLDFAYGLTELGLRWVDLIGRDFHVACHAALSDEGVELTHPDVAGTVVRDILTCDVPEQVIRTTRGPADAAELGYYDEAVGD